MTYLEYRFRVRPLQPASDMLMAELGELGFESFVETDNGVLAYVQMDQRPNEVDIGSLFVVQHPDFEISWSFTEVEQQNWNAEWEKNFHPINVGNRCRIRAPFHSWENVEFDIIIEPKMSFGTGHHETTHMMLQLLLEENMTGKKVLDMGSGTGVLAILTEMMGADNIMAVDIDAWCFENARENVERNQCKKIQVVQGDAHVLGNEQYDLIIANINRNILLKDIPIYASCLKKTGDLFLSGFYLSDLDVISAKCGEFNLKLEKKIVENDWVAVKYVH